MAPSQHQSTARRSTPATAWILSCSTLLCTRYLSSTPGRSVCALEDKSAEEKRVTDSSSPQWLPSAAHLRHSQPSHQPASPGTSKACVVTPHVTCLSWVVRSGTAGRRHSLSPSHFPPADTVSPQGPRPRQREIRSGLPSLTLSLLLLLHWPDWQEAGYEARGAESCSGLPGRCLLPCYG